MVEATAEKKAQAKQNSFDDEVLGDDAALEESKMAVQMILEEDVQNGEDEAELFNP